MLGVELRSSMVIFGLPQWLSSKESTHNVGDSADAGLILGLRRSPGEGHGNWPQYPCLENPMDRGAWELQSMGPQRVRQDWSDWAWIHACTCLGDNLPHLHHFPRLSTLFKILRSILIRYLCLFSTSLIPLNNCLTISVLPYLYSPLSILFSRLFSN